jgi:hypothetical protein
MQMKKGREQGRERNSNLVYRGKDVINTFTT